MICEPWLMHGCWGCRALQFNVTPNTALICTARCRAALLFIVSFGHAEGNLVRLRAELDGLLFLCSVFVRITFCLLFSLFYLIPFYLAVLSVLPRSVQFTSALISAIIYSILPSESG